MAIHVKNMDELSKAIQPMLQKRTNQLADRVYETLNYFLKDYVEIKESKKRLTVNPHRCKMDYKKQGCRNIPIS